MTAVLLAAGASVFVLLGAVHALLTVRDLSTPRTFTPPDAALRAVMQSSTVAISPAANLWRAWLGFNLSHALGVVVFGASLLVMSLADIDTFTSSITLRIAAPLIGAIYMTLAKFFWFRDPLVGTTIGTALLLAASIIA
jgi:hypothetical protein